MIFHGLNSNIHQENLQYGNDSNHKAVLFLFILGQCYRRLPAIT